MIKFNELIQQSYMERKTHNSDYSLGPFSRHLGIDQFYLSKIINGQRKISSQLMMDLLKRLGANEAQVSDILEQETSLFYSRHKSWMLASL